MSSVYAVVRNDAENRWESVVVENESDLDPDTTVFICDSAELCFLESQWLNRVESIRGGFVGRSPHTGVMVIIEDDEG